MTQTFEGGCHCGRVRFRVTADLDGVTECNCSICTKKGFLHLIVPPEQFELISGKDDLTTYQFNTGTAKHTFCKVCGIHSFYVPRSDPDKIDVNARCLDGVDVADDRDQAVRRQELGDRDRAEGAAGGERARRRDPRRPASHAGAGLLRGHRFLRRGLSRELSALHGARPHQLPAAARRRSARAVRGDRDARRPASLSWCARCRSSSSSRRAWTTCSRW